MIRKSGVVLVADDDEDDRLFLTEALLKVDPSVKIIEAENGFDLLQIVQIREFEEEISLIIIDMNMPRMNGIETIEALKLICDIAATPILMLSTASDFKTLDLCLKAGFRECHTKPNSVSGFLNLAARIQARYLQ